MAKQHSLAELLEEVTVHGPDQWKNEDGPKDWYAVSREDEGGIIAYFGKETYAYAFPAVSH